MTDDKLEREIEEAADFLYDANEKYIEAKRHQKYWADRLAQLIAKRSPEQVEKMEKEMGLT